MPNENAHPRSVPALSVIVPVRNDPRRLRRCLAALRRSSFGDFEIIVADDASRDATPAVAEAAAKRLGPSVRILRLEKRMGPAGARNRAADFAEGDVLFFIDADVLVHADATARVADLFTQRADVAAVFGSYDAAPEHPALVSQYKNLSHHFVHQQAHEKAVTFWAGCGAIRRKMFLDAGGFDTVRYRRPCIEDIELGARLARDGKLILVDKRLQGTHLKRWRLGRLILTDVFDRGIPWTRLILREKDLPADLNLGIGQRLSAMLAAAWVAIWLMASWAYPLLLLLPPAALATVWLADKLTAFGKRYKHNRKRQHQPLVMALGWVALAAWTAAIAWIGWSLGPAWSIALAAPISATVALNWRYYAFLARERSIPFAAGALPLQGLYYMYSLAALAAGITAHVLYDRGGTTATASPAAASAVQGAPRPASGSAQ